MRGLLPITSLIASMPHSDHKTYRRSVKNEIREILSRKFRGFIMSDLLDGMWPDDVDGGLTEDGE